MYITKIKLKDVRCFTEVAIDLTSVAGAKRWLVVVGNNGVGKTSFLASVAMGLCDTTGAAGLLQDTYGEWIRKGENEAVIEIDLAEGSKTYSIKTTIGRSPAGLETITRDPKSEKAFPWKKVFVCGYGANRSIRGDTSHERYSSADAVYTMFNYDYSLQHPELMLRRRIKRPKDAESICKWLDDVLMLDKGSTKLRDEGIAITNKAGQNINWGAIGDGYEAIITVVLDMLGWSLLADKQKEENKLSGIVLIDELEQHLHPELQRHIISKLHKVFPEIQFIATSHSPLCAAGLADLDDDKCSLELLSEEGGVVKNEPLSTMKGWRYDQILTSTAFGVIGARNVETEELINRIRILYMKETLSKREKNILQKLLKKLEKESLVAAEAESLRITQVEISRIKQQLQQETKKDD